MSTGSWGIKRSATVSVDDVDVFLIYSSTRESLNTASATALNATQLLVPVNSPNTGDILGGMYTLRLPTTIFNAKGFYNILIRPKEFRTFITDCGVLSARPDIKGLVLDSGRPEVAAFQSKFANGGLVGYRIEYIDPTTNNRINNFFRIVTSANRCEPVTENLTNTNQKAIRYRFNDIGSLVFLTLTPSSAPSVKPNAIPFIGTANQQVIISNTFFDPIMLEIEMVDQTIETLAHGIFGAQTKSIADGKYTVYTTDTQQIYKQYNLFEIQDEFGQPLFEVKTEVTNIDNTKDLNTIINSAPQ